MPAQSRSTLYTQGLGKAFNGRTVVKGVDLEVSSGEVVGLLGPNGAGKTTTFYMVVGLIKPNTGRVMLDDQEISQLPMHLRARKGLGYLAQEPSVFRKLTVEENILAVWELLKVPRSEQKSRLDDLMDEFHLGKIRKSKGFQLSGGERRRVEIARALATDPSFLLLDEPFSGIDPLAIADIKGMLRQLKARDIGLLLTDHNVRDTLTITDRAYILSDGKVIDAGTPEHIAQSDIAKKFYLGEDFCL
ncbi:MAG TPA: LPS export ABC transporter ATP-binding protein [Cyanobacteria bacterium UBA8530]|nr:LPS export ABC transporter ATP-binding protein [Cyanobacteria bacterium UBA8530]